MPSHKDIDRFTLAFHHRAVERMRVNPRLVDQARSTLQRWREQRGPTASDPYFEQWDLLLRQGVEAVERATCDASEAAVTLRSVSPLGFVLSSGERAELLKASGC